jgi:glutathione S-transferase
VKLRSSLTSPFGRKIRIALAVTGLDDRVELVLANTGDPADSLRQQNPLGKVPTLLLDDGSAVYDSAVILDLLDGLAGRGTLIPTEVDVRAHTLTRAALADGIIEAALLIVQEGRFRPEGAAPNKTWIDLQADKVTRGLTAFEASPPGDGTGVEEITLACALGYQDMRFKGEWRASYPRLVAWLDGFAERVPAFAETTPPVT